MIDHRLAPIHSACGGWPATPLTRWPNSKPHSTLPPASPPDRHDHARSPL